MKIIRKIRELREEIGRIKLQHKSVGFVPTMGALHAGHISLIRQAHKENNFVVVSIFVNPAQFGPKEDFKKYPRTLGHDAEICRQERANIIFYPSSSQMYNRNHRTSVVVEGLSNQLCGKVRPGHFKGVATVVTKLFNIVTPDIAYFGQKDAQQAIIVKSLVKDLNIPVKIKIMPIVRNYDGLALSSRNVCLNPPQKTAALVLSGSLHLARNLINRGVRDSSTIIAGMKQLIRRENTAKIDYISIVDSKNLKPIQAVKNKAIIALAVWIGKARLIDNYVIRIQS